MEQQKETTVQLANDKKILQQMEETILRLLSESKGMILDDQVLIDTLASSKKTSIEVRPLALSVVLNCVLDSLLCSCV